jgi:hypothetical protein
MQTDTVCQYTDCRQEFIDPRILPCGQRVCASHIPQMRISSNHSDDIQRFKCFACSKVHVLGGGDEFPSDLMIHNYQPADGPSGLNTPRQSECEQHEDFLGEVSHVSQRTPLDRPSTTKKFISNIYSAQINPKELKAKIEYFQSLDKQALIGAFFEEWKNDIKKKFQQAHNDLDTLFVNIRQDLIRHKMEISLSPQAVSLKQLIENVDNNLVQKGAELQNASARERSFDNDCSQYLKRIAQHEKELKSSIENLRENSEFARIYSAVSSISIPATKPMSLNEHQFTRSYECSECKASFTDRGTLRQHMWVHSSEAKRYHCSFCSYRCNSKSNLVHHTRTHTGEKPFKCKECDYCCAHSSHLGEHVRRKHKKD